MKKNKIFSFVGTGIMLLVLAFFGAQSALANVTGDLPGADTGNFYIAAFSDAQDSPCDGTADDGETKYAEHDAVSGDATYNDDNDYTLTFSDTDATTNVYFCEDGTTNILANISINHDEVAGSHIVDLGRVTGNGLHADLTNDYVIVCDGSTQLSTVNKQIAANTYDQYFAMDDQDNDYSSVRAYLAAASGDGCTFDASMSSGKTITTTTSLPDNYGIYTTFAPDTKNVGDLHADLDAAQFFLYNSSAQNIGFAIESYTDAGVPDGDGADDDYTIYYDKPSSNDMKLSIISASNGTTDVYGIAYDAFTAGYDFYLDAEDATGGVPSTVSYIRYVGTAGTADAVTYVQDPRVSGSVQLFDLYVDTGDATDDIEVYDGGTVSTTGTITGGTKVFQIQKDLSNAGDESFDVASVAGEMHASMETTDDLVAIYSDATCSTLVSSETVYPAADGFNTTDDYEIYFEETGADYYMLLTEEAGGTDYASCGNHFTLTNQAKTAQDITVQVSGIRHADMAAVLIDNDKGATLSNGDVWTTSFVTNVYHAYTVSDSASQVIFDDTDNTFAAILLTTVTEKNFSSDSVVSAAKVSGADTNIHADLENDGGGATNDLIMVTTASASGAGTDLASVAGIIDSGDNGETTDQTYSCYFEVPTGGLVNFEIQDGDAANAVLAYAYNFTSAGAGDYTFEPSSKVTATLPATALGLEIQQGDLGGYNMRDNTSTFIIYVDKTNESDDAAYDYRAYTEAAFTNVVLDRSGKDVSGSATWGVNTVTNTAIHVDITGDTDPVDVYSTAGNTADCTTTLLSSDTAQVWANGSLKYFERANGDDVVLKVTDGSYVSCVNTLTAAAAAGGNNAYSLDVKTSGNVNPDIITVYIDADEDTNLDISQTAVVGTPSAYAILWAGDADSDMYFYNVTPAEKLDIDSRNLGATATVNVAKVSGNSKDALTTVDVYSAADCATGQLSSEIVNPGATYAQYFEGVDGGSYYVKMYDGTYTTCQSSALTVATQTATAHFDHTISGTVPDISTTAPTDLLSVAISAAPNTYWSNAVDGGTTAYIAYIDGVAATGLVYKDTAAGAGTTLLTLTKDASAGDVTANVSAAYGESHADIREANGVNAVCADHSASNTTCATKYSTVPQTPAAVAGADYEIFFEQQVGTTYYLEVLDTDTQSYYSWNMFTSAAAGDYNNVELDGKLDGYVAEAFDSPTTRVPGVTIKMYTNAGDPETNQIALTYSYAGTADPGGNYRMYGNLTDTNDAQYAKAGYITQSAINVPNLDDTVNVDLVSGLKVTVSYEGGQKVTDATVSLLVCGSTAVASCTTTLDTCANPSGDCTIIGDGTAGTGLAGEYYFGGMTDGTYVQVKVVRSGFDTVYDPDPASLASTYTVSSSAAITPSFTVRNSVSSSPTLVTPADKLVTTDTTPDFVWSDLGGDETDYEVQIDDDPAFASVHAGGGTTGSGSTVTFTADSALTDDTLYYWRVRGIDGNGNGSWSVTRSFYVNAGWNSMAAPTLTNTATTSPVTVTWTAETGATSYKIYRKNATPVAITDTYVGTSVSNSFIDTNPADGSWYYGVVPVDGSNTAGTISTTSAVVTVDTTAPTSLSLVIESGADYTTDKDAVTVAYAGQGSVATYSLSCDGSTWVALDGTSPDDIDLDTFGGGCTATNETKTFYLKAVDATGNTTANATDEIILDNVAPVITGSTPSISVSGGQVTVTWTAATDATSGVDTYSVYRKTSSPVATTDTAVVSGLTAVGFVDAFSADGDYYYGITATDKAGNTSAISTTSAIASVDVTGPTPVSITINSNATYATSATLTLALFAGGSPSTMAFSCDGSTYAVAEAYATSKSLVLGTYGGGCTATDGVKTVYVKMIDAGGNATYAFDYITLDTAVDTNLTSLLPATDTTQSSTSYTWSWTAAADAGSGVDHYYVQVSNDAGSTWTYKTDNTLSDTYTLTGLAVNSTGYQIKVTAYDKAGNAGAAVTSAGLVYVGNTATITALTVTPASTTATVAWTTSVNSTSNTVEYGLTSAVASTQASSTGDSVTTHSASLTGLTADKTYYYRVKSTAAGVTTYSDILTFTTSAATTGISVDSISMIKTYATADDTFANGWKWAINISVWDTTETQLKLKLSDWASGANTFATEGYTAVGLTNEATDANNATILAATEDIGNAYTDQATALTLVDSNATKGGIQDTIYVYVMIPTLQAGGSYTSSYGIYTTTP